MKLWVGLFALEAGGLGLDGASGGGEKREEEVGVRFPYLARAGVEQGGGGRERASVATAALGGGIVGSGRGAGGGGRGRGSKGDAEAPFIGRERRWRGGGAARGRWPAREHRGAPLMALRPLAAVVVRRTGGETAQG